MVGVGPPLMPSQDVSIHVQVHASPHHSSAEDATVDFYYFLLEISYFSGNFEAGQNKKRLK